MTAPLFPYLPGLSWPVDRAPIWDSTKQIAVSGKETRFTNRTQPRYGYTLTVEGLDANGSWPTLAAYSKQALEALFNNTFGGAGIFNFWDTDDCTVFGQPFGLGDGATTAFQLFRTTAAGWSDAIFAPVIDSAAPVQVQAGTGGAYAPNNLIPYSSDPTNAAWTKSNITVASGVTDPFGGSTAATVTATGAFGYLTQGPSLTGLPNVVFSVWLRRRTGSGNIGIYNPTTGLWSTVSITPSWVRYSLATLLPVSSGIGVQLTTSGDAIDVYGPQIEATNVSTPGAYLATAANAMFGSPMLYAAGALQAPTAYTISSSGLVTFTSAPAVAAALTWTGGYWWPCNFDDDTLTLSKFMGGLWDAKKLAFTTRIY